MNTLSQASASPTTRSLEWPRLSRRRLEQLLAYALLVGATVLFLLPFFWMISTSLKPKFQVFLYPPEWLPATPMWSNYPEALMRVPFGLFAANTMLLTAVNVIGHVLSCSVVGFAFARLRFPGKKTLFAVLIATLMVPEQVTFIPVFVIFRQLGWLNT